MTIDLLVIASGVLAGIVIAALLAAFRYIPNDRVGIVEKLWSSSGSVKTGLIALNGEAGFQPMLLRGGWHVLMPFQYRMHKMPLVTIPQGRIGYVFARDGQPLPPTQTHRQQCRRQLISRMLPAFFAAGGQRGPQRKILREGTYALNLAQFVVVTAERDLFPPAREVGTRRPSCAWPRSWPTAMASSRWSSRNRRRDWHRDRARRPVAPGGADHRADGRATTPGMPATVPQQLPGRGEVPAGGGPSRPPAADARRGHVLHQPTVRHGRDDPEDRGRGRQRRRRRLVHRRDWASI